MNNTVRICFTAWCMVAALACSAEPDNRSLKDQYQGSTQYARLMCTIQFKSAQLGGEADFGKCVADNKLAIKKSYDAFAKLVKKQAAKTALKEHYIAAISGLQGIEPQSEERKINYEKRQGDNQNKIDELWVRFETEN